jgi:hypothetical protein
LEESSVLIKKTDRTDQSNQLDGVRLISAHYQTASDLERHISGGDAGDRLPYKNICLFLNGNEGYERYRTAGSRT